ncbi:MAG: beta-N-acetylhexosaminidase [Nitrospirota bacterium]
MKLAEKIGQLLMVGFEGTTPSKEVVTLIQKHQIGGVILFSRNIKTPAQCAKLTQSLQALSKNVPLLIGIDQEGGRVSRLPKPFIQFPPAKVFGQINNIRLTYDCAVALSKELNAVGINMNFAPVLDVDTNPDNPIIGDRAFGQNSLIVEEQALALMSGLQDNHIIACGKHFPGHGDTNLDSHKTLPKLDHPMSRLNEMELKPFIHLAKNGLWTIMTAHVLYSKIDAKRPASLSKKIVTKLLREKIGFSGVIVSDDLEMKGITEKISVAEAAVLAIEAGSDLLLICKSPDEQTAALEALIHAVEKEELSEERIDRSIARLLALKERAHLRMKQTLPEIKKIIGCDKHRALIDAISA